MTARKTATEPVVPVEVPVTAAVAPTFSAAADSILAAGAPKIRTFAIVEHLDEYTKPVVKKDNEYHVALKGLLEAGKSAARLVLDTPDVARMVRGFQNAAHDLGKSAGFTTESEEDGKTTGVLALKARVTRSKAPESTGNPEAV